MKLNLHHNPKIKSFDDIACHLLLEAEVMAINNHYRAYVASTSTFSNKKWGKKGSGLVRATLQMEKARVRKMVVEMDPT